jgi:hypothetical protein
MVFPQLPECSWLSCVLDSKMDDARDDSWRGSFETLLYLVAKPSSVKVNVHGLACPLHHPTTCFCHTRGQGLTPGVVLSCHCCRRWHLLRDVKLSGHRYLMEISPL